LSARTPIQLQTGRTIELNARDSWDSLLYPVTRGELPRIALQARKLLGDIERLRETRLVRRLDLPDEDLLGGSPLPKVKRIYFQGLLNLPKLAKGFGSRKRPDYTRRLTLIYQHIHECTRQWYDAKVADILNDLLPDPEHPHNAESLKQWRSEHGVTD
jgi:hypothetical protein